LAEFASRLSTVFAEVTEKITGDCGLLPNKANTNEDTLRPWFLVSVFRKMREKELPGIYEAHRTEKCCCVLPPWSAGNLLTGHRSMSIRRLNIAATFLLCLLPVLALADSTLRFLLSERTHRRITLAVTPARRLITMASLIRFRRMFGLFAFFYGCLHFLTYTWFDKFFDIEDVLKDIAK
jgi:hypothetical protein